MRIELADLSVLDFVECPTCSAKPGSPELCRSCLINRTTIERLATKLHEAVAPIPMLLTCPTCGERHIDEGEFATKPHHTHACQSCGMVWRPAIRPTCGVQFLPGFKNAAKEPS